VSSTTTTSGLASCSISVTVTVAVLLRRDHEANQVLKTVMRTDGSFGLNVKVPDGCSVEPASHRSVDLEHHTMNVVDAEAMRAGLDAGSLDNTL
jgi:hypothetical protein